MSKMDPRQLANEADGVIERIVPGQGLHPEGWEAEHLLRYRWAARHTGSPRRLLDLACGVGYGHAELSKAAPDAPIISCDVSHEAVSYGRNNFGITGLVADGERLPFLDGAFDVVVSLETVEHVPSPKAFMTELRRVLRPNGKLLLSTPNALLSGGTNPYHLHEFEPDELSAFLQAAGFRVVGRWGQHWAFSREVTGVWGLRRAAWEAEKLPFILRRPMPGVQPGCFCWLCVRTD